MNRNGFTLIEVIVALVIVGVGVVALLGALTQGRRNVFLARQWADEESRANALLFGNLECWQKLRTDPARQSALVQTGTDPVLGNWEWRADRIHQLDPNIVDLYAVKLHWGKRDIETRAVLRVLP